MRREAKRAAARPRSLRAIFAIPLALFGVSLFGLVASLLVEGPVDAFFALAGGCGIMAAGWALLSSR